MLGLRTQETNDFIKFFEIVQKEASKRDKVFFLDAGCGDQTYVNDMDCESLFGWLIPKDVVNRFLIDFEGGIVQNDWDAFYATANYVIENGVIKIKFTK